ncbi:hypothetical protein [Candidatus Solirubrobacter pratensis]|uniref:hypothetical protein n=1 Tax=Candidatus Solirubrobacter pratensis TaxID=1298857 RepID=UPI0004891929|nr:hypothetical protein [Candidatus Solirubrobacter pratensis]
MDPDILLSGTTPTPLPGLPAGAVLVGVTSVADVLYPGQAVNLDGTYRSANDYTVDLTAKTISRVAPSGGDGKIPDHTLVAVTYQYVPSDYFDAILLEDLGSIADRFGPAWKNGAIFSQLTYAAQVALENGARFVICQPLYTRSTPGNVATAKEAPIIGTSSTAKATSNPAVWSDTLYGLRDIEDINVFVPVVGQSTVEGIDNTTWIGIAQKFQDHMKFLKDNDQYSVTIFGEDRTADAVNYATKTSLRNDAGALAARYGGELARQSVLINTASFLRPRPDSVGGTVPVGAQYMAAAIAGMLASRPTQQSLTRSQISGFLSATDTRSKQDKNDDAAAGLMVIEQKGNGLFVRHGITLDTTAEQYQEVSVVRSQHRMVESLRTTVDTKIIGKIIADAQAPYTIKSTIIGVLEALRGDQTIVNYGNVQVRQLTAQPTTFEVRFSYLPAFPVNYVNIKFSIDLSSTGVENVVTS